jgi:hypothetical protein
LKEDPELASMFTDDEDTLDTLDDDDDDAVTTT